MPFYDGAYPEKHWSVSPGILVVVIKRSLSLIFVPLDEKSSEESTSLEGNYYLTIIANKFLRKVRSKYQLEKNPSIYILLEMFLNWIDMPHFEASWTC